ncbi:hypothetical protein GmHk_13G038599 [Glycine max]|nr:hypothetical protein GmHk_13G038599 [Glycine max]
MSALKLSHHGLADAFLVSLLSFAYPMSIFSSPSTQHPRSFTRLRCCSLEMTPTSFINSSRPCPDALASLFTAISWPSGNNP